MLLSIIIVNWNVKDLLRACLLSVEREMQLDDDQYEVIVVDNNSADNSVEMIQAEFPGIQLIASDINMGFGAGCNKGYARSRGGLVLLLNPDTEIRDHAIDSMIKEFTNYPDAGVMGARLINGDGTFQRASGGTFPTLARVAGNYLFLSNMLPSRLAPDALFMHEDTQGTRDIDWVSGASMLLRREALDDAIFDESYFMFGEDMDLCYRLRKKGWRVIYSGHQSVLHYHGKSFAKQSSLEVLSMAHKGPRLFFSKHHSRFPLLVYDSMIFTGFLLRWPLFRLLALLRKDRNYADQADFSRRYVISMFKTMLLNQA